MTLPSQEIKRCKIHFLLELIDAGLFECLYSKEKKLNSKYECLTMSMCKCLLMLFHIDLFLTSRQQHQRVAVSTIIAAVQSATSIRIVPKKQRQLKMSSSNTSSDLLSSIMDDHKKMLMTIKQEDRPSP